MKAASSRRTPKASPILGEHRTFDRLLIAHPSYNFEPINCLQLITKLSSVFSNIVFREEYADLDSRPALRRASVDETSRPHAGYRAYARARHRREHDDVQPGGFG